MTYIKNLRRIKSKTLLLFVLLVLFGLKASGDEAQPTYKINSVKAYLYYTHTATFSENIIDNDNFVLWNVIIGEGSAKGPSDATMIIVEIVGRSTLISSDPQIEFTAVEGGKTKLSKTSPVGLLERNRKYFAAYWLYDTGCGEVSIHVRLLDKTKSQPIEKKIPFRCGE